MTGEAGTAATREHGGDLGEAVRAHGGAPGDWLDLSTGINPRAWGIPPLPAAAGQDARHDAWQDAGHDAWQDARQDAWQDVWHDAWQDVWRDAGQDAWRRLPDAGALAALLAAARAAYAVPAVAGIVAAPGASALIRLVPRLLPPRARPAAVAIPGPTYNEHAAAFAAEGWRVRDHPAPASVPASGVTAAVVVNPNNPDGRRWDLADLRPLAEALDLLVVDESFMDPTPGASMVPWTGRDGLVVLRSFGKFFGLAGLRLGFAVGSPADTARLADLLGPWAVSGPAIEIGRRALADAPWIAAERARLPADAARLASLGRAAGWAEVGGTALFRTFETGDARAARDRLAARRIWSRTFAYAPGWLRLGLPGDAGWARLEAALGVAPEAAPGAAPEAAPGAVPGAAPGAASGAAPG